MKKIVKSYGNTLSINFNKEMQKAYGIKKGSIIEIDILSVENTDNENEQRPTTKRSLLSENAKTK